MTVGEMKKALAEYPDHLPVCVLDSNEECLHPTLTKSICLTQGSWCDDLTDDRNKPDRVSEYIEVAW